MSGIRNGLGGRIIEWVTAHPGPTAGELGAALSFDHHGGMLSYMLRHRQVFASGPRKWQRIYATLDEACDNHARITAEAIETRERNKKASQKIRGRRRTLAAVSRKTFGDVSLHPQARIVVQPPQPGRFDPGAHRGHFSSMAIGSYLPSDSAIARAYKDSA